VFFAPPGSSLVPGAPQNIHAHVFLPLWVAFPAKTEKILTNNYQESPQMGPILPTVRNLSRTSGAAVHRLACSIYSI
jgi:hypothetical protein